MPDPALKNPPPTSHPQNESAGPIVGAIIIIILLIIGGFYFLSMRLNQKDTQDKLPFIGSETSVTTNL